MPPSACRLLIRMDFLPREHLGHGDPLFTDSRRSSMATHALGKRINVYGIVTTPPSRLCPRLISSGVGDELQQAAIGVPEVDAGSIGSRARPRHWTGLHFDAVSSKVRNGF